MRQAIADSWPRAMDDSAAREDWGFAPAFGTGVLTGLCAALLGMLPTYLYFAVINPGFSDVLTETQRTALVVVDMQNFFVAEGFMVWVR